jgi:hypothetical protein
MKKHNPEKERILGRKLARELTHQELAETGGGSVSTWTTSYPADGPYSDGGGGGPVYT